MHTPRNLTRKSSTLFTLDGLESRALLSTVHPLTNFLKSTHNHVTPPQPLVIPAGTIIPIDSDPLSIVNPIQWNPPITSGGSAVITSGAVSVASTINLASGSLLILGPLVPVRSSTILTTTTTPVLITPPGLIFTSGGASNNTYSGGVLTLNGSGSYNGGSISNITSLPSGGGVIFTNPLGATGSGSSTLILNSAPIIDSSGTITLSHITGPGSLTYLGANTTLGSTFDAGTLTLTVNPFTGITPLNLSNLIVGSVPSTGFIIGFNNGTLALINETPSTDPTTIPPSTIDNANATLTLPDPSTL